jgi:hypothetical protein
MQFWIVSQPPQYIWPLLQQWPALHVPLHVLPQPPQFALSMASSTHLPEQSDVPPAQRIPHLPAWQNWPLGHVRPQPLQLFGSFCVSTHVVAPASPTAHDVQPDWHVAMHLLAWQIWPLGQGEPHALQLSSFCVRSTQLPLQFVSPSWQLSAHVPLLQTSPVGHFLLQPPQLLTSTPWSMQSLPQWIVGLAQTVAHAPCEHTRLLSHAFPHAPQLSASDCVSTHVSPHLTAVPGPHGPTGVASLEASVPGWMGVFAQLVATRRAPNPAATKADFHKAMCCRLQAHPR